MTSFYIHIMPVEIDKWIDSLIVGIDIQLCSWIDRFIYIDLVFTVNWIDRSIVGYIYVYR